MTVPYLVHEQAVRDLLELELSGSSKYQSGLIASNIRAASWFLEKATNRIYRDEPTLTLTFTTENAAHVYLPGLRAGSAVTLNGSSLTADSTYWLIPDLMQTGVYLGIRFRVFDRGGSDGPWYLHVPDWWDRNLDHPYWNRSGRPGSIPNDLVISGAWGYTDATLPEPVRDVTKVLAAFKTLRPDAFLSGARQTENGIFDLSQFPIEVQSFVADWRHGAQAVGL